METPYPLNLQYYWSLHIWFFRIVVSRVLTLCRDTVCVFYSASRLDHCIFEMMKNFHLWDRNRQTKMQHVCLWSIEVAWGHRYLLATTRKSCLCCKDSKHKDVFSYILLGTEWPTLCHDVIICYWWAFLVLWKSFWFSMPKYPLLSF